MVAEDVGKERGVRKRGEVGVGDGEKRERGAGGQLGRDGAGGEKAGEGREGGDAMQSG